ncbi:hypothetical protein D4764_15G0003360 [Takifugu flavidus]|uniref:Uncharacterized protein n=1 Tax=Takifugu flavidus TaxID=433684 RepID=A0A5C6NZH8_9TELE|nr:hypothetical protein D4764_15G0003360 [Takifugu flavidus]
MSPEKRSVCTKGAGMEDAAAPSNWFIEFSVPVFGGIDMNTSKPSPNMLSPKTDEDLLRVKLVTNRSGSRQGQGGGEHICCSHRSSLAKKVRDLLMAVIRMFSTEQI